MKKLITTAFCLGLVFGSVALTASPSREVVVRRSANDERKAIQVDELPEPVKKALTGTEYKGWTVKQATQITHYVPGDASATQVQYEVKLTKGQNAKTVAFHADGSLVNKDF